MTANSTTDQAEPDDGEVWAVLANGDRRAIVQALAIDRTREEWDCPSPNSPTTSGSRDSRRLGT